MVTSSIKCPGTSWGPQQAWPLPFTVPTPAEQELRERERQNPILVQVPAPPFASGGTLGPTEPQFPPESEERHFLPRAAVKSGSRAPGTALDPKSRGAGAVTPCWYVGIAKTHERMENAALPLANSDVLCPRRSGSGRLGIRYLRGARGPEPAACRPGRPGTRGCDLIGRRRPAGP